MTVVEPENNECRVRKKAQDVATVMACFCVAEIDGLILNASQNNSSNLVIDRR
jgi:hypothetical protein